MNNDHERYLRLAQNVLLPGSEFVGDVVELVGEFAGLPEDAEPMRLARWLAGEEWTEGETDE